MSYLPQQFTVNQYVADGVTTKYNYTFTILSANAQENDLSVYVTLPGHTANPLVDIQPLNTAYIVDPGTIGNIGGGFITFQMGYIPVIGAIVTLARTMAISLDTEFALAQNFSGANLDTAFERVTLILNQLNTDFTRTCLSYVINSYLPAMGSNFLPVLTSANNQVWISQGGQVVAAVLQTDSMSTFRAQIASQAPGGGDGAGLVGYYNPVSNTGTTVDAELTAINAALDNVPNDNLIIGGSFTTNPFQRGTSTVSSSTGYLYVADRFAWQNLASGAGRATIAKVNDSPTAAQSSVFGVNSLKVSVTTAEVSLSAGDVYGISYRMEGYDFTQIAQASFTLSFWVKTNLPATYCIGFTNAGADRYYVAEYTVNASNTWEFKSITVPASPSAGTWNYTNGIGIQIIFSLAIGSTSIGSVNAWTAGQAFATVNQVNFMSSNTNTFQIDRVKVEAGIFATPAVNTLFADEMSLCQRYYQKSYDLAVAPGSVNDNGLNYFWLAASLSQLNSLTTINLPTRMRAGAGSAIFYSNVSGTANTIYNVTTAADVAVGSIAYQSNITFYSAATTISASNLLSYQWAVDAEL